MCKFVSKILLTVIVYLLISAPTAVASVPFSLIASDSSHFKNKKINSDSWFSRDKGLHFSASLIATVLISKTAEQSAVFSGSQVNNYAAGFSISLGIGKELWDGRKSGGFFSLKDLAADMAGVAIGLIILRIR